MDFDQPIEEIQREGKEEGLYDFSYDDDEGNAQDPDGAIDDETNMSALDLYTDMVIRDSEEAALSMAKLKEEKTSFKTQLDAALIEVTKLTKENESLTKENQVLKSNISILLKTAKMELQRKDRELNELRDMQLVGGRPTASAPPRKTRRLPKHHRQPGLLRQNGTQHPKNINSTTKNLSKTAESDSDVEQKPNVQETMFVRRQRAKNQRQPTTRMLESKVLSSEQPEQDGSERSIGETLLRLSQQSSHEIELGRLETKEKNRLEPLMTDPKKESLLQGTLTPDAVAASRLCDPKYAGKPEEVHSSVMPSEAKREKMDEKERSRSRSIERSSEIQSKDKKSIRISDDHRDVLPRSQPDERSSRTTSDYKRSSPSRSTRSRSDDNRSSRSKSRDRISEERTIEKERSRRKSVERTTENRTRKETSPPNIEERTVEKVRSRSKSVERTSKSHSKNELSMKISDNHRDMHPRTRLRKRSPRTKSDYRRCSPSRSNDERFSRSDSRDRAVGKRSSNYKSCETDRRSSSGKPCSNSSDEANDPKLSKNIRPRKSSSSQSLRSGRDVIVKQAESLAFNRSGSRRGNVLRDRHNDRDRRDSRRSSTPIQESSRDSCRSKEIHKTLSSIIMPSRRERSQSRAKERMSSIARDSVAKAKAVLSKRSSSNFSPNKSQTHLCFDGLTDWAKTDSSLRDQGSDRKRKHRLSSSLGKESQLNAKKLKAGSSSADTYKLYVETEIHLGEDVSNTFTYEEGHTVLACGTKDSIECTSSKVLVPHSSVSDSYDTTQSDMSYLYASGFQGDNGGPNQSTDAAGLGLIKETEKNKEDGELSEGEIISDDDDVKASRTEKSKHSSSGKKKMHSSKHKHSHHHTKHKSRSSTVKTAKRGKKHKRKSSSEQEALERKKRIRESNISDDSIQSKTPDDVAPCATDVEVLPCLHDQGEPDTAYEITNCCGDQEKDGSVSIETKLDNHIAPSNEPEGECDSQITKSALRTSGDIEVQTLTNANTSSSPVEGQELSEVQDERINERIRKTEDHARNESVTNLNIVTLPQESISTPIKESAFEGEPGMADRETGIANVSRGILFEDLCLSSSVDDTSYLSCVGTGSENVKNSFLNSLEKPDGQVKDTNDSLGNNQAFKIEESQTGEAEIDDPTNLNLQHIHAPLETNSSECVTAPSNSEGNISDLQMENTLTGKMVAGETYQEKVQEGEDVNSSLCDASVELNTSKSSEPVQGIAVDPCVNALNNDDSVSDHPVFEEENDAVSLHAGNGGLDSFMHDSAPKLKNDFDQLFSEMESVSILKESEQVDEAETSLQLTCEWSNIEFQDSSTKMGAEPGQGSVTVGAPVFDDGCAQDMDYAKNPLGIDMSLSGQEEGGEMDIKVRKENGKGFSRSETGETSNEKHFKISSGKAADLQSKDLSSSKVDPLNLGNVVKGVCDAFASGAAGASTVEEKSSTSTVQEKLSNTAVSLRVGNGALKEPSPAVESERTDEQTGNVSPSTVTEVDQEHRQEGERTCQRKGRDESLASSNATERSDEGGSEIELDFIEDVEEEQEEHEREEEAAEEEQEDSIYIIDIQPATSHEKKDDSCSESEEEREGMNQSGSSSADLEGNVQPFEPAENSLGTELKKDDCKEIERDTKSDNIVEDEDANEEGGQKCEDSEGEEGEILEDGEEEETVPDSRSRHDRKRPREDSRTDQRHEAESERSHPSRHHHRTVHRISSSGKRESGSDSRKPMKDGRGERGRSGSSEQRSHRDVERRESRRRLEREDRDSKGKLRSDERHPRSRLEERQRESERKREEDSRKTLDRRREEDRRRMERKREDQRREARRLEEEREEQEERRRVRRREESEKARSKLHDIEKKSKLQESEKKREPQRKSKKASESRKS
ncbi:uncharacterized protein LOC121414238 [Lytechinus variegatus]|uniref:uncharacterized protein LOC121414238 n=1 Tax=Lytechinus variegatus TaxID=7654 RepID=UPI001BB21C88|nr:uncharacterized protein LOC121414238 [Lytechinus variegatus]